jgi:hypothetical protein
MQENVSMRLYKLLPFLMLILLTACASTGPATIARDRFDYITAISDSWKRQMMLNLLKIRYTDAPVFMDVASVINSYEVAGEISLKGQVADKFNNALAGDQFLSLGAIGRYSDKPTISYQPLSGDKFARSIMMPIPISAVLFLMQSGYPADMVMRICLNSINGIDNSFGGPGNPRTGSPKFHELMSSIRLAMASGEMGMRIKTVNDKPSVVISLRQTTDTAGAAPHRRIRDLLSLDESAKEFTVVLGDYPDSNLEVSMLTRSILQVMVDAASYIDVPASDLAEGRVYAPQRTSEQERLFPPLIAVRTGSTAPGDAFVKAQYRNQWFWIEDRDRPSKQMLTFLMMLFSLTETSAVQAAPILTVPTR